MHPVQGVPPVQKNPNSKKNKNGFAVLKDKEILYE